MKIRDDTHKPTNIDSNSAHLCLAYQAHPQSAMMMMMLILWPDFP